MKFKSLVIPDSAWEDYPDAVKNELSGASACIWTIAVMPSKLRSTPWETTIKTCRDYATFGLKTLTKLADSSTPLRFVYINAVRDPAKKPFLLGDYFILRGEAEKLVIEFAKEFRGAVEAAVAKPGLINGSGRETGLLQGLFLHNIMGLPKIGVDHIAAALIDQVLNGFESDTLTNEDMVRIGRGVLNDRP